MYHKRTQKKLIPASNHTKSLYFNDSEASESLVFSMNP